MSDGGPAFPTALAVNSEDAVICSHDITDREPFYGGISTRDYFAAAALTGILANVEALRATPPLLHAERAEAAYKAADAMLAEREKGK